MHYNKKIVISIPGLLGCHGIPLLIPIATFPPVGFSMQLFDKGHHPYIFTVFDGNHFTPLVYTSRDSPPSASFHCNGAPLKTITILIDSYHYAGALHASSHCFCHGESNA